MINKLLDILKEAIPNYEVSFEESRMMNVAADTIERYKGFAYIEEYRQGYYSFRGFQRTRTTRLQIYFCKFVDFHDNAINRELMREKIEEEAVIPFVTKMNENDNFKQIERFDIATPLPRFDANEVSVRLEFDLTSAIC